MRDLELNDTVRETYCLRHFCLPISAGYLHKRLLICLGRLFSRRVKWQGPRL